MMMFTHLLGGYDKSNRGRRPSSRRFPSADGIARRGEFRRAPPRSRHDSARADSRKRGAKRRRARSRRQGRRVMMKGRQGNRIDCPNAFRKDVERGLDNCGAEFAKHPVAAPSHQAESVSPSIAPRGPRAAGNPRNIPGRDIPESILRGAHGEEAGAPHREPASARLSAISWEVTPERSSLELWSCAQSCSGRWAAQRIGLVQIGFGYGLSDEGLWRWARLGSLG